MDALMVNNSLDEAISDFKYYNNTWSGLLFIMALISLAGVSYSALMAVTLEDVLYSSSASFLAFLLSHYVFWKIYNKYLLVVEMAEFLLKFQSEPSKVDWLGKGYITDVSTLVTLSRRKPVEKLEETIDSARKIITYNTIPYILTVMLAITSYFMVFTKITPP